MPAGEAAVRVISAVRRLPRTQTFAMAAGERLRQQVHEAAQEGYAKGLQDVESFPEEREQP